MAGIVAIDRGLPSTRRRAAHPHAAAGAANDSVGLSSGSLEMTGMRGTFGYERSLVLLIVAPTVIDPANRGEGVR